MTKDQSGYNGWTNYQSWAISLHVDNDNTLQDSFYLIANSIGIDRAQKEKMLKGMIEDANPLLALECSVYTDLLQEAIDQVNWGEVLDHYTNPD